MSGLFGLHQAEGHTVLRWATPLLLRSCLPDIDAASPAVADAWRLRNVTRESVEIPFSKITKALAAILAATVKTT